MSTPSRGAGNAKDPISLDSSDEDVPTRNQVGPSRSRSRPTGSTSSPRRSGAPQTSGVVDLTLSDSGSDSARPNSPKTLTSQRNASSLKLTGTSKFFRASSLEQNRETSGSEHYQPIAGPSRMIIQGVGEPGSWTNPATLDPFSPSSSIALIRGKSDEPAAPVGSWLNPRNITPLIPRPNTAEDLVVQPEEGSWLRPAILPPHRPSVQADIGNALDGVGNGFSHGISDDPSLPLASEFELPPQWTNQESASNSSFQPQSIEPSSSWTSPATLLPTTVQPQVDTMDDIASSIDPNLSLPAAFPPTEKPAQSSSTPITTSKYTSDVVMGEPGSWTNPVTIGGFSLPHPQSPNMTQPELGSWLNPATLQPLISYKRSASPTELDGDDSRSRKGKARRMVSPIADVPSNPVVVSETTEFNLPSEPIEQPKLPVKKGPSWVTSEQPVLKKSDSTKTPTKSPEKVKDDNTPISDELPRKIVISQDIAMQDVEMPGQSDGAISSVLNTSPPLTGSNVAPVEPPANTLIQPIILPSNEEVPTDIAPIQAIAPVDATVVAPSQKIIDNLEVPAPKTTEPPTEPPIGPARAQIESGPSLMDSPDIAEPIVSVDSAVPSSVQNSAIVQPVKVQKQSNEMAMGESEPEVQIQSPNVDNMAEESVVPATLPSAAEQASALEGHTAQKPVAERIEPIALSVQPTQSHTQSDTTNLSNIDETIKSSHIPMVDVPIQQAIHLAATIPETSNEPTIPLVQQQSDIPVASDIQMGDVRTIPTFTNEGPELLPAVTPTPILETPVNILPQPLEEKEISIPQTPEISMPQTPTTNDTQEVEAALDSYMISPIADLRGPAVAVHHDPSSSTSLPACTEVEVNVPVQDGAQAEQNEGNKPEADSSMIHPLPTLSIASSVEPQPESESEDPLLLQPSIHEKPDMKPVIPTELPVNPSFKPSIAQSASYHHPIELDDDDLDCLTSDKEDDSPEATDAAVEQEVEEVRMDLDEVEILPSPQDLASSNPRNVRRSSSVPSVEEIQSGDFIPKVTDSRRLTNRFYPQSQPVASSIDLTTETSPKRDHIVHDLVSSPIAAASSLSPSKARSLTPKVEVIIPTRSRNAWRWIVEHEGESDVEDILDDNSAGSSSSRPSDTVDLTEHNGYTLRSAFKMSLAENPHIIPDEINQSMETNIHTILAETLPDPLPPLERIGRANRVLNTKLIDEWNRRKPHLTNNPSLHRAVFEAYMAQSTSIDEPQADEIRVINDIDHEGAPPDFEFQYSNDMLYNPDVPDPELGVGCDCDGPCNPNNKNCSCVRRQELYFYDLGMKGFAYDHLGRIKETSVAVWECGKNCGCPPECQNRVIQRGRSRETKIELFKTKWKGWGVRARANIPAGTFLGIYAGELITEQESEERGKLYAQIGRTYLFDCDGWQIAHPPAGLARIDQRSAELAAMAAKRAKISAEEADDPSYVYSAYSVDAFHYGFTRYFNHSCDPNLAITQAYVKDFHPERPILVIFARRNISRGEELCISYKGLPDDDEIPIPVPQQKLITKNAKQKKSKTSASAHITGTTKGKMAAKDQCMCKTARCDGRMFNYGG
ncbi:uncharacterized protein L201_002969 [Kwoniella dendrophila CBS 6074]|uniref:SET domain-containing protein n=1 Tax=Kwoniella dendrophila CBS 6074 TaxID=1295534 RepID=A0AAX4JRJ3_9TREE